ncbi:MAG: DUF6279 family lipoprotein [Burkholderiaceae bacterium]
MRRWIIGLLCAALLAVAGCSFVRLGYNQGPELGYWWLDRHADFDSAQAPRVREALADWFAWHRREQLPDYARLLARAQEEIQSPLTADQVCAWVDEGRSRARIAVEQAVPAITEIAVTLTPRQIDQIERRQAKANAEYREESLQPDPAKRAKAWLKRNVERAEMLYGKLDASQRDQLAAALAKSPYDAERAYAQRRRSQQEAVQILRQGAEGASRAAVRQALSAYTLRLQRPPADADEARHAEQVTRYSCTTSAALHNSTSPEQRRHAADKLAEWVGDARVLAAQTIR